MQLFIVLVKTFVSAATLVFRPSYNWNLIVCINYSTDPVELREWLLLYNVQHKSLWFLQMETLAPQHWSSGYLTIEN